MLQLSWFYRAFLRELYEREIRYLLVGGYAVRYYGYARKTRDLDIWIPTDFVNAAKVCELCRGLFDLPDLPVEPFATDWRLVNLTFAPSSAEIRRPIIGAKPEVLAKFVGSSLVVEILTIQSGVDFESCYKERPCTQPQSEFLSCTLAMRTTCVTAAPRWNSRPASSAPWAIS
jgi:hypothetical protein